VIDHSKFLIALIYVFIMQHESLGYKGNRKIYPPYFGDYLILHKFNQHFLSCEQLDIDDNRISFLLLLLSWIGARIDWKKRIVM
jgi:hypothetical protein